MTRKIIPASLACAAAVAGASEARAQEKPNVVIIVADDLGWGDVGYHGSVIKTPNIDRIARSGIELDRYYTAPVSSPTRAGLLTGQYPSRFGIRETVLPPWRVEYGLDLNARTMADVLGENGYRERAALGKWHLGHGSKPYYPLSRGFTHFYGCLNGALDYFTHEREGELDWHNDWESCWDKGYTTDLIAAEAVKCIENYSKGSDPYFVYVAFNAPHTPFQAPEDEIAEHISPEQFAALTKKQQDGYTYRAMVSRMDKGIGKILAAIEKSGEKDNTILLFMSDNGGVAGIPDGSTCKPLRGNKFTEWDGGVRVPAAIWWPKGFKTGTFCDQVTGYIDILPTLADIVGVKKAPAKPYDGISVKDVFAGKTKRITRDMYLGAGAAVNQDYKFVLFGANNKMEIKKDFLAYYPEDKYEQKNHIDEQPKEAARLREYVLKLDAIEPSIKELPYDFGKKGFVAPKEWKISND